MENSLDYIGEGALVLSLDMYTETENNFYELFKQYERVLVESIASAFLLDSMLIQDRIGGNVDTIHNVRRGVEFKDKNNEDAYLNRGDYDSSKYHSHKNYREENRKNNLLQEQGNLFDSYTKKIVSRNERVDLDHTISAKEIHDDKARVLAGIHGEELANSKSNLNATNMSINRSKSQDSSEEFIKRNRKNRKNRDNRIKEIKKAKTITAKDKKELNKLESLNKLDEAELRKIDKSARKQYDGRLNQTYYNSELFLRTSFNSSARMGKTVAIRQGLGFVFTEVWIIVRKDMEYLNNTMEGDFSLEDFIKETGNSFIKAMDSVRLKYKDFIASVADGFLIGVLSDISSTILNIFTTTSKSAGRIIRQSWSSLVEAVKILIFNKDGLGYGEQIKAVSKIIFTSMSVILGSIIQAKLSEIIILPILRDVIPIFVGSLVTGITSISILYYMDNSERIRLLVEYCNENVRGSREVLLDYQKINQKVEKYAAELYSIDYESFKKEIQNLYVLNDAIYETKDIFELNIILTNAIESMGIKLPYSNMKEMDDFVNDTETKLIFGGRADV